MPTKKKKFIDKNAGVTFHLVHRSQKDPLQADEDAAKHVLVQEQTDLESRKEEQRKFGVYYEDEYNYLQHMKDAEQIFELEADVPDSGDKEQDKSIHLPSSIQLPSSVFASEFEKPVGLLNEAVEVRGPQPDWDPDIVEGLDDDFDFDNPNNQIDDDFIVMANAEGGDKEKQTDDGSDLENVSDLDSDCAQMSDSDDFDADYHYGDNRFMDEETKSRFTEYSVSSSVIRRNEGLTLLDDRFEKLFEAYDDSEIGALDQEEIDGSIQQGSTALNKLLDEFEISQHVPKLSEVMDEATEGGGGGDMMSDDSDTELVKMDMTPAEKWDCESILSTYSNIYNHPKLITEPRKTKVGRHSLSETEVPGINGLTRQQVCDDMAQRNVTDKASTYRPKGETTEERAERKKAVKADRKERRLEKKSNKMAFTSEKIRQDKEIVNINKNLKGIKIV